jgi:hypothetical protein
VQRRHEMPSDEPVRTRDEDLDACERLGGISSRHAEVPRRLGGAVPRHNRSREIREDGRAVAKTDVLSIRIAMFLKPIQRSLNCTHRRFSKCFELDRADESTLFQFLARTLGVRMSWIFDEEQMWRANRNFVRARKGLMSDEAAASDDEIGQRVLVHHPFWRVQRDGVSRVRLKEVPPVAGTERI